ncbi:MAG: hypothetical protein AAF657_35020 [Acidobacteriota bacterium]
MTTTTWPTTQCFEDPNHIVGTPFCLAAVSKNAQGVLDRLKVKTQQCPSGGCPTLRTVHQLEVQTQSHAPCDSALSQNLDGIFVVKELYTAFDGNGERRGFHVGKFEWNANGGVASVVGEVKGITNAGTHRAPIFQNCQPCDAKGFMEGYFCGRVVDTQIGQLKNCFVQGTYRFRFDPSQEAQTTSTQGTLEAVLICPCP